MEPVTGRRWVSRTAPRDFSVETEWVTQLGIPGLVARLLISRRFSLESAREFLNARLADLPDPFLLPDMNVAAKRLAAALESKEKMAVHGDYDVDGISATALLMEALAAFGGDVEYHIPLRLRDGYGLSAQAIQDAAEKGVQVIVSVDCGVSAHEEADLARQLGIDLIITDHHQPPPSLPRAAAIINPQRRDSEFPFRDLAGVGVAFFLVIALRKTLRERGWFVSRQEPDLRCLLDLVALGTIADLVPLLGVNRILSRHGLELIERSPRYGIRALMQVASVTSVTSGTVGFQLAPRLNAAGRLEDASLGVELLLEEDMVRALRSARHLDQCNRERQELEKKTLREAEEAVAQLPADQTHAIVLAVEGWHPGVIGIVASRLVERYHRPTVLVALDGETGKGSARSIQGYHLYRGIQACADHLITFGGHAMAAGLSLESHQVTDFAASLERHVRAELNADDLVPTVPHDGTVLLEEVDLDSLRMMQSLSPFGMDNPEPQMIVESVRARQLREIKGGHLGFTVCQGAFSHPAIAFGMQGRREEFQGEVDLLVSPQINLYQGRQTVQLRVRDVRPGSAAEAVRFR